MVDDLAFVDTDLLICIMKMLILKSKRMALVLKRLFANRVALPAKATASALHTSCPHNFHFMKRQVTVDPELAKLREGRKRRKLEKAIRMMTEFSKKPKPLEEVWVDPKHRETMEMRRREPEERTEEQEFRKTMIRKNYSRTRARLARDDLNWIKQSIEAQRRALELLQKVSPRLYEAAVQPDEDLNFYHFEGPPTRPAIEGYRSPDGDYQDVTKQWQMPVMPMLDKKLGVGKLIKGPKYKKKQLEEKQQKAQSSSAMA